MKLKKRTKSSRMHGRGMGSHSWGARKRHRKSGHHGGKGMAGSGKRADHKKTLITKLYGNKYFGKQGITSKGTERDKGDRINLREIESNISKYSKDTKSGKIEINLKSYKILGTGNVQNKLIIKANAASKSAIEKVKAKGGEIIIVNSLKINQTKEESALKKMVKKVKEKTGEILLENK